MAVPDFQTLMRPVLETLVDKGQLQFRQLVAAVSERLGLTREDLDEQVPSGQSMIQNRMGWAVSYLVQAGTVVRPRRGYAEITERGRDLLTASPGRITIKILDQFPEFVEFRKGTRGSKSTVEPDSEPGAATQSEGDVTPVELVGRAEREANAAVQSELLSRVHAQPPEFLERLVLKLLVAMGYGDKIDGADEHRGRSGDEGVDGIIRQDPLGLELVYLQAKRYAPDATVGRPDIQAFVGALHGAQASRGVFITTSRFSSSAVDYAERVHNARVILIDGRRLAELMLRHGIGVEPDLVVTLYRVDEDFFES